MGLLSFLSPRTSAKAEQTLPVSAQDPDEIGAQQLRSLSAIACGLPIERAKELFAQMQALNILKFETDYASVLKNNVDFRETYLVRNLLSNLLGGNYLSFFSCTFPYLRQPAAWLGMGRGYVRRSYAGRGNGGSVALPPTLPVDI